MTLSGARVPLDIVVRNNWYTGMVQGVQFERDRAYRGLVDLILGGAVDPAVALSERSLSESLEIGRTPVREALRDLVRDGVLEVRPARGTYVRAMKASDVAEIYEVRLGLEGVAARLAAEKGATPALRAFGPLFSDMLARCDAYDPEESYEAGARFHSELFRAAGNRHLLEIYEPLRLRFRLALSLPRFYDHARVRASVAEHLAILEAVESADGPRAEALIREHLSMGSEVRARIFADITRAPRTPGRARASAGSS